MLQLSRWVCRTGGEAFNGRQASCVTTIITANNFVLLLKTVITNVLNILLTRNKHCAERLARLYMYSFKSVAAIHVNYV